MNARLRYLHCFATIGAALWASLPAYSAAPPPGMPAPHNLQIFPKDIKTEQLIAEMDRIAIGLGVPCGHCHASTAPPPGVPPGTQAYDFASDAKPAKQTARQMIAMLRGINSAVAVAANKSQEQAVHIQCVTCHRGMAIPPLPLAEVLNRTSADKGISAAIAQFRELRQKYFGSQVYDFGDGHVDGSGNPSLGGIAGYALQLIQGGRPDDALVWLNLNLEYFPESTSNWALIGFAHLGKGAKAPAIEALKKALKQDPGNAMFKTLLGQAEAMP